jgi:copper transport protein
LLRRALPLLVLLALAVPAAAKAHATLVRSDPTDRSVLESAPKAVRFFFDDGVRLVGGIRAIRNGDGSVLRGQPRLDDDGKVLVVPLRADLSDGDYTVLWRALSDDGHHLAGVIAFGVGRGRAPPTPALAANTGPTVQDVLARWLFFAGLLTVVGAAFFRLVVGPVPTRLLLGAFLLTFLGISSAVHDVSLSTRFGSVMSAAALVAACGALLAALAPLYPKLELAAATVALLLLPVPSLAGHALDRGRPWYAFVVDLLHVGAASVWLGGLIALGLALRSSDIRMETARQFSTLALGSVLVLALTGVIRVYTELDSLSQLWTTGYGQLLIVKSVLLVLLAGFGWVNRYRLLPRRLLANVRRNIVGELLLFVVLVGAVALLTDLRPGRDRGAVAADVSGPPPAPGPRMIVQAQQDDDRGIALAYAPPNAQVTVLGPDGQGVSGLEVSIAGIATSECGPGCYRSFVAPAGEVTVTVDGRRFTFQLPVSLRSASSMVARATRVFRSLVSVSYVEDLASSPRNRVVADFVLEQPDRLEYRIRGGADGIIIGARRWDRDPGGPWVLSEWQPSPQPEPVWAGGFTNAYVLRTTPMTYVVSFMKPIGPAWFTLELDRRTLRPHTLKMTATSHFMTHVYAGFNAPRQIRPPR